MAWDFLGLIFGQRDFLGFVGNPRDFLSLDFCSHSIIPITLNPEYPPGPTTQANTTNMYMCNAKDLSECLHSQPLGESQPLKVFHRGLLEMLNTLLQNQHSEDSLKCIGKMLKVC